MPKPALPTSRDDRARAYLNVLFEINSRLKIVESLKPLSLPYGIAREICHLQLRHICELVAIGCLVIQADYKSAPSFTGEYNPQKVFRDLDRKFPGFFPQPAVITRTANGDIQKVTGQPNPSAITRKELETLWGKTGGSLHRLRIHNFFRLEKCENADIWPDMEAAVGKIEGLLGSHIVPMYSPKVLVIASLTGDSGKPLLSFFVYSEDGSPSRIEHFHGRGETAFWGL